MRPETPPVATPPEDVYPSCETTLWQIGQWRCDYWRPEGRWSGSSLRLFRADRLVKAVQFGLRAREQSRAWRAAVRNHPNTTPADFVDENDGGVRPLPDPTAMAKSKPRR
jgi:hypothetical protein